MALFPVFHVFWQNNMVSTVENTSWKPLERPFSETLIFEMSLDTSGLRNFDASSKAIDYSLSACYLKTFWQPWFITYPIKDKSLL